MPPKKSSSKSTKKSGTKKSSTKKSGTKKLSTKKSGTKKLSTKKSSSKKMIKNNMNNNIDLKKYNLNKTKSNVRSFLVIALIFNIITIIFFSLLIYYLNSLKSCNCYLENEDKKANLDYLIVIEAISLAFNVITFIYILSLLIRLNNFDGGSNSGSGKFFAIIFYLLYLFVYGYFVYNIYLIADNIDFSDNNCECSENPLRYLLYAQGILVFVNLLMFLFIIISTSINY